MKAFPSDSQLQSCACLALRNLTFNSPPIIETAGSKGAIEAVLMALKTHPDNVDVTEQAVVCLFNMVASHAGNLQRMEAAPDYVETLLGALRRFHESENVQATALSILEVMVREHPGTIPGLLEADGMPEMLEAMRGGITQRPVMHQGAATLRALFASDEHRPAIARRLALAGGLPALLELLYISSTYKPPARY